MNLTVVKALSALVLMLLTFIVSILPMSIFRQPLSLYDHPDRHSRRKRIISYLSCFAGGVFLGTCLLHLFPDVGEQVDKVVQSIKLNPQFPIKESLLGFGFLTILIVEQIQKSRNDPDPDPEIQPLIQGGSTADTVPGDDDQTDNEESSLYVARTYGAIQGENAPIEYNISFPQERNTRHIFHDLLLLYTLSLHSLFEGLAIGLQATVQDDLRILLAVLIHKCIIAFSLGLKLTNGEMQNSNLVNFLSLILFSISSPIGILIGIAVINLVKGFSLLVTSCILQGLAAGTFLYVTLCEVLLEELSSRSGNRLLKVLFVLIGYSVVSFLVLVFPD